MNDDAPDGQRPVTNPRPSRIFHTSTSIRHAAVVVALVTATVTAVPRAISAFTAARCPNCRTLVMAIPGAPHPTEARVIAPDTPFGDCRGRVVRCPTRRCHTLIEIVEHG
jgi:hypothetical protein